MIIQEGVPTFESIDDAIAEPVVYMVDRFVVGGFYRVHTARGKDENLNAPGAQFVPLAFESPCIPDLDRPGGLPAQPLLRLRRRRAARAARRIDRDRGAGRSCRPRHRPALISVEYCQLLARYNRWMNERLYARRPNSPTRSARATAAHSSARCIAR